MTLDNSSSTHFALSYEGPALADNSMSASQLGPAITALGELLDRTNELLNGEGSTIDIKATATRPGSFEIGFAINVVHLGYTMLSGPIAVTARNIRQLVTLVITWLKRLGKGQNSTTDGAENGRVQVMESIGLRTDDIELTTIATPETNRAVLETVEILSRDQIIREHLRQTAEPVSQNGVDSVSLLDDDSNVLESIEEADLSALEPSPQDSDISEEIVPSKRLTVINPYLGPATGQWRLHDGERSQMYDMMDDSFASDVRNGIVEFRAEDILVCQVRYIRWRDDGESKESRAILEVLSHDQVRQIPLPGI